MDTTPVFPRSKPPDDSGFEVLQHEETGRFYFTCYDGNCQPILFSEDYFSQSLANAALEEARVAAAHNDAFQRNMQEDQFYFLLQHENQKLAQSVFFDTEQALETSIKYVQNMAAFKPASTNQAAVIIPVEMAKQSKPLPEPDKYAFKLDFYNREHGAIVGKIENVHDGVSTSFQGIDGNAILQFIKNYIQPAKPVAKESTVTAELQLLSQKNGHPVKLLPHNTSEMQLLLTFKTNPEGMAQVVSLPVEISALDLKDGRVIVQMERDMQAIQPGSYQVSMPANFFGTGMYRLKAALKNKQPNAVGAQVAASCLIQVY